MRYQNRILASIAAVCCLIVALGIVKAQTPSVSKIQRIPIPNSDFPISLGVWVPAGSDTLYLSGNVPPVVNASAPKGSVESYGGSTEAQTVATIQRIQQALESQN
jgi:enamine deaminase RidA (YjgF/YER057c/UK114 family)